MDTLLKYYLYLQKVAKCYSLNNQPRRHYRFAVKRKRFYSQLPLKCVPVQGYFKTFITHMPKYISSRIKPGEWNSVPPALEVQTVVVTKYLNDSYCYRCKTILSIYLRCVSPAIKDKSCYVEFIKLCMFLSYCLFLGLTFENC